MGNQSAGAKFTASAQLNPVAYNMSAEVPAPYINNAKSVPNGASGSSIHKPFSSLTSTNVMPTQVMEVPSDEHKTSTEES